MTDLTACFFCGNFDDRLIEHPVVPEGIATSGERERTVEVCTSCRSKLTAVQDAIVDAADDPGGGRADPPGDDPGREERRNPLKGEGERGGGAPAAGDAGPPSGSPLSGGDPSGGGDRRPGTEGSTKDEEGRPGTEGSTEGEDGQPGTEGSTEGEDGDADRPAGAGASQAAGGGDAARDREPPAETRKIVRLLQNREFPVERSEIEAVATNAYDLTFPECEAAIDALVEGGVLREEDGLLHRSEGG